MGGFTGWYDPFPKPKEVLEQMTAQLLSIIDLAASHQPIVFGSCALAYNGELYNFLELRAELEKLGHVFQTQGDTEVLLHALIGWKERALAKLQGMFAFTFWDGKSLLLARDHPKWGFVLPLEEWMAGEWKPIMNDALGSLQKRNIFLPHLSKRKDLQATRFFALLSLELWFCRFVPDYRF